jgi:hypothetical protein
MKNHYYLVVMEQEGHTGIQYIIDMAFKLENDSQS